MDRPLPPFNQPEQKITGIQVLADDENPGVRLESRRLVNHEIFFSVTGPLELGRQAIAQQLSRPLAEPTDNWRMVKKGLASIGYPSRRVARLHRSLPARQRLEGLRPSSQELARIIKENQPTIEYHAKIPVFNFYEAMAYAQAELPKVDPGWLSKLLTGYDGDTIYGERIRLLAGDPDRREDLAIAGLSLEEQREIRIKAMLGEASGLARVDALYSLFDEVFEGHLEEPVFDEDGRLHGGFDHSVFVRKQDIPAAVRDTNNYLRVAIGPRLRDDDRRSGLPRHEVSFITRRNEVVALRRVTWINHDGERRFVFPTGQPEQSFTRPSRAIGNSVLGAARIAELFGEMYGVDYGKELDRLVSRRRFGHAGLLGLVLHSQQDKIFSNPYFEAIEAEAVKIER